MYNGIQELSKNQEENKTAETTSKNLPQISTLHKKMSSREIAELTKKAHKNIIRDVESLINKGVITELNFEPSSYKDGSGKSNPMYELDFSATMILITGYDAKRRSLIINRWIALETGEATPMVQMMPDKPVSVSQSYKETEVVISSLLKIGKSLGISEPMAKAVAVEEARRVTGVDCSRLLPPAQVEEIPVGIRQLAKELEMKEKELGQILAQQGYLGRDENKNMILTDKAKELKMGSLEPFQSKFSKHVGYQVKWFPSVVKSVINNKQGVAA